MKYIKLIIMAFSLVTMLGMGAASASPLKADPVKVDLVSSFVGDACSGLSSISTSGCTTGNNTFKSIAKSVVEVLSIIIGIISVIMILISGFRFITAGSDSNAVAAAKNTLIYALVGLAIAVLAQVLVHEVLNTANNIQNASFLNNQAVVKRDA